MISIFLMKIVWAVYLIVLLPLYILKEKKHGLTSAVKYKLALSGLFCLIGLLGVIRNHANLLSVIILLALIFSMLGDYFLVFIKTDEMKFIIGILCFAVTQILYIILMFHLDGLHISEFLITALIVIFILTAKQKLKPEMGKAELPISGYAVVVTFMAVKAVLMLYKENSALTHQEMFSAGAFLFYISDILLGIWNYLSPKKILRYLVSICYFIGQLLIATAMLSL